MAHELNYPFSASMLKTHVQHPYPISLSNTHLHPPYPTSIPTVNYNKHLQYQYALYISRNFLILKLREDASIMEVIWCSAIKNAGNLGGWGTCQWEIERIGNKKTGWMGAWIDGSLGMDAQTDRIDEWINGHTRGWVYGWMIALSK